MRSRASCEATNNALTVTLTLVNREPTAIAIVAAGAGYAVGDTFTVTDATGLGFVSTVSAIAYSRRGGRVRPAGQSPNMSMSSASLGTGNLKIDEMQITVLSRACEMTEATSFSPSALTHTD